ncbi:MAG: thioesterase family protein [Rubrivivax sp.]
MRRACGARARSGRVSRRWRSARPNSCCPRRSTATRCRRHRRHRWRACTACRSASGSPATQISSRTASPAAFFRGRCAAWFRLQRPLVEGEVPSGYQRVAVAADSGNGISAVLDFARYSFVNSDLTINLLRRPQGEWICVDARTLLAPNGCGLAESQLFDEAGLIGRATQSLAVRMRG